MEGCPAPDEGNFVLTALERLLYFIKERESIRLKKERGESPPWTLDKILSEYRFCNVYREDDTVTKWISDHWLLPNKDDPDAWFAMVVARHLNLPESLSAVGYPAPWNPAQFLEVLSSRKRQGMRSYNSAYMIRANAQQPGQEKALYLCEKVFNPLWKKREHIRPREGGTLDSVHQRLQECFGLGSFLAAQVIADVKFVEPLKSASDWWDFAASGPGSARGLNRVLGRPVKAPWKEEEWRQELIKLRKQIDPEIAALGFPRLSAQNLQNVSCEFDKYERVRLGEGRPKRRYVAKRPQLLS